MMDSNMATSECATDGLEGDMTYFWRVRAHNAIGWGDWSGVYSFTTAITYICGDCNNDGNIDILDISFMIAYLYLSGPPPTFEDAADVNNDGIINMVDVTVLVEFLYNSGADPYCG